MALVAGGVAAASWFETESLSPTAGSCWKVDGDEAVLVGCSHSHDYKGITVVSDSVDCPASAVGWVEGDASMLVCLVED